MFPKLQYITANDSQKSYYTQTQEAFEAGCTWVQLRIKNGDSSHFLQEAQALIPLAQQYKALLTINDRVEVALQSGAHGVHLGKTDMPLESAQKILPKTLLLGATANTFEDVQAAHKAGAHYIGLGPYRFTQTKANLSPILGIQGYSAICAQMHAHNIQIPVYAIGGITLEDLPALKACGIYGIALSGLLYNSTQKKALIQEIHRIFE